MTIVTFTLYGIDKHRAKKSAWRIPENTLLGFAAAFGGFGAFLGMRMFRHKTKHTRFKILVPLFMVVQFIVVLVLIYFVYVK